MTQHSEYVYDIYHEPDTGFVVMQWKGYATSEQFRQGTELMLNTLVTHKASKVLADIRDMLIIGMEDQHWLQNQFIPRAIGFGFKAIAIVKPISYFNKVAVETISYKIDQDKLTLNFFDTPQEARQWLAAY